MKKRVIATVVATSMLIGCTSCSNSNKSDTEETVNTNYPDAHVITLSGDSAVYNDQEVQEYDYTWHCDPSVNHDEVSNAPAEYYTGSLPDELPAVYIDHELYYYPELEESSFASINYDGEREYAYYYNDGVNNEYIFATLPMLDNSFPSQMMHSEEEAGSNKVLHITEPGTYIISGNWSGQIKVNLGDKDEVFTDESQKVTLVLSGANIECTVAPGIIFESVYECDNTWEDNEEANIDPDLTNAGAVIVIADGTENVVTGTNVFRMLKTKYKDDDSTDEIKLQKKMRKTDGALYSYMSMVITGEAENTGTLEVNSGFEGVDSELHLGITGGNLTINSQDDGMNVNEDNVSVLKFTGGSVVINAAQGAEGDGVDSNGYVRIDGGNISVNNVRIPDSAIDTEDGIYYISGTISIDGTVEEHESGDVFRETGDMHGGPGGIGGFPNGDFPEGDFPEGSFPAPPDGDFSELPNGDIPTPPDGEIPEFPNGDIPASPIGERPELPDGVNPDESRISETEAE